MRRIEYRFKRGSSFSGKQKAESAGRELEKLEKEFGWLDPKRVVSRAKAKRSPLHGFFTWDDSEAARLQRLNEARSLVRSVEVKIIDLGAKKKTVMIRAFVNLRRGRNPGEPYYSTVRVMKDRDLREVLVEKALEEATAWHRRYSHLSELAGIFQSIDRAKKRKKGKGKGRKSG